MSDVDMLKKQLINYIDLCFEYYSIKEENRTYMLFVFLEDHKGWFQAGRRALAEEGKIGSYTEKKLIDFTTELSNLNFINLNIEEKKLIQKHLKINSEIIRKQREVKLLENLGEE